LPEYAVSKLCYVLHAKELARRLASTKAMTYSLHPGRVASDIWGRRLFGIVGIVMRPFLITNEVGARTQLRCATDPTLASESGLYYAKERSTEPNPLAHHVALQDELRRRCEAWTA
jgi:NAD(P)-dependent dehydrogenase (short-subunit alcohol dehydrogenase family)